MIAAHLSDIGLPPGKYKLSDALKHMMEKNRKGIKKGTSSYRNPPKRTRPYWLKHEYHPRKAVRLAEQWKRMMEEKDPDGLLELWTR